MKGTISIHRKGFRCMDKRKTRSGERVFSVYKVECSTMITKKRILRIGTFASALK